MKKIIPILVGLMAASGLTGCGKAGDDVFAKCLEKTLASAKAPVLPGFGSKVDGDETPDKGSFLKLTTKQVINDQTVEIEWDYESSKSKIYKTWDYDETHIAMEMKFPGVGEDDDVFNFTIKSMKCGSITKTHDELVKIYGDELDFKVTIVASHLIYDELTIKQLSDLNDTGNGYYTVDYEAENIYFKKPHNQDYWYSTIKGKVLYMSPDFNWGLVGDGDRYTQVYFGGSDASRQNNFPALKEGNYVEIRGNIGAYSGNHQFTFINRVHEIDPSEITEPSTAYKEITEQRIAELTYENGNQEYVVEGFMNSLASVTGKYIPGTLKKNGSSKALSSMTSNERHTFQMQVGEQVMKIAYDYHVADDNESVIKALNGMFADNGASAYTLKGCVRYEGESMANTKGNGDGVWVVVPFLPSHVSK